jgi:hypothetical protein
MTKTVVALAVIVGLALIALLVKVTADDRPAVDDHKLRAAQAAYSQWEAAQRPAASTPSLPATAGRSAPTERATAADRAAPSAEPDPEESLGRAPRVANIALPALSQHMAQLATAKINAGQQAGEQMDEVNSLYDRADYEGAREAALEVLKDHPHQVRMLRVVVSSSCIMGDHAIAQEYFAKLVSDRDRQQMIQRCERYGVDLQ